MARCIAYICDIYIYMIYKMKYRSSRPSPWMLLAQAKRCAIVGLGRVYFGDILVNLACCGVLLESAWTPCLSGYQPYRI